MEEQIEKLWRRAKTLVYEWQQSGGILRDWEGDFKNMVEDAGYRLNEGDEDELLTFNEFLIIVSRASWELWQRILPALKAQKALTQIKTAEEIFGEMGELLTISENEMGFVEISNHVDFGDYQTLKSRHLPTQSDKGAENVK